MLSFPITKDRKKIQSECDEWGSANRDWLEGGSGGLPYAIKFTDKMFEDYDDAYDYLEKNTGNYKELAVKYKQYPRVTPSKTMADTKRRIDEYANRLVELNKPHYKGVKQATVKCKHCGSSIATKYCGNTWVNNCPVCKTDLRPQSTLDKIKKYNATLSELRKKLREEEKKQNKKLAAKAEIFWLVCCEVHC